MPKDDPRPLSTNERLQVDHDDLAAGVPIPLSPESSADWGVLSGFDDPGEDLDAVFADLRGGLTPSPEAVLPAMPGARGDVSSDHSRDTVFAPSRPRVTTVPRPKGAEPATVEKPFESKPHDARSEPERALEPRRGGTHGRTLQDLRREVGSYRDRMEHKVRTARTQGQGEVFALLLPLLDAIDQAIKSAPGGGVGVTLTKGLVLALERFESDLLPLGLERVPGVGSPFDPRHHDALRQVSTGRVQPGSVARGIRRGYRFHDKLLRSALVEVET